MRYRMHAEVPLARKTNGKTNLADEKLALAA